MRELMKRIDTVEISEDATITQLKHEEDDEPYQVWRIDTKHARYILKEAKGNECEFYSTVLSALKISVPALYQVIEMGEKTYLLLEYIAGEDLCRCNRSKLTRALDALISLQKQTWQMSETGCLVGSFDQSFLRCKNRGKYLCDSQLETAYEKFLGIYESLPKTFCHDDLLPFNVIVGDEKAVLIDWECGGILPYPAAFARLIAHGEDACDALFYMTSADRHFAIDYFYENLLREKGIAYTDWLDTLEYFLFYEYCEWVFVGNRYDATDGAYYQKYLPMAKQQAAKLLKSG